MFRPTLSPEDTAARQIVQQEDRIERQKEVIAALENDGHEAMAKDAQRLLGEMLIRLARMYGDLTQAQKRVDDY
jgi:uncharacterized protein YhaN